MAIPAQVQRQSEAISKLYEELNSDDKGQVEETEAAEEAVETADSEVEQAPAPQQAEQKAEGDKTSEDTLEQKYKTLQGMYNAEVPRLHAEKRQLTTRVEQLEKLLSSMSTASSKQAETPAEKLVTEQDVEDYGDSIDVMRRVYREEIGGQQARINQLEQLVRQMQASVVPQVQQISHRQSVSAEQAFWADLQAAVPDWQDINADQGFQSWLLEADPLTGMARQTYLDTAQRDMDARRVANFFNAWKGTSGQSSARENRAASANELEKQVAPGRGKSGSSKPQGTEGKTYNADDIKNFFTDVQKGRYRGKEAERDRIERDIFAAQREGRIVTA